MIVLGVIGWTLYARLERGWVLALREEEFIAMARLSGSSGL
jgi:ABC-type dipeptide/oligopeptide/nickel transport system permease subunit